MGIKVRYENIKILIKQRRKILGISQDDLALLSNIGLRTIKALESGKANPRLSTLNKVFDVLGLELVARIKVIDE